MFGVREGSESLSSVPKGDLHKNQALLKSLRSSYAINVVEEWFDIGGFASNQAHCKYRVVVLIDGDAQAYGTGYSIQMI